MPSQLSFLRLTDAFQVIILNDPYLDRHPERQSPRHPERREGSLYLQLLLSFAVISNP